MRNAYPSTPSRRPLSVIPANADPQPGKRTALITLQEELQFPSRHGLVSARRMKIMHVEQTAMLPEAMPASHPAIRARTPASAHLAPTPHAALPPPEPAELECVLNGQRVHLRSVAEAMTDEAGNLYEVHGQHLRPLGELVGDERGRIFEVQPARQAQPIVAEHPRASASKPEQITPPSSMENGHHAETTGQPTHTRVAQTEPLPAYRKIIAGPGLYVKLPWARVKGELALHLQHPEHLRDDELLECSVQIYEAQQTLPAARLAALALGDAAFASQLQPLIHAKAQMLGAVELFKPTPEPFETRGTSRQVYAGQRFYRLRPVFDPTSERIQNASRPAVAATKTAATTCSQIPPRYLNPLQFTYSREEVLYDMNGVLGALPPHANALTRWLVIYPLRWLKVSRSVISSGRRLKKWRAMLKGKSFDDQLWAVTPPRGFSSHPAVRRWAEEVLTQAGYDPGRMLVEWEIFWRRKGRK